MSYNHANSIFPNAVRYSGPFSYTVNFCDDWKPLNANETDYVTCGYVKCIYDLHVYDALATKYVHRVVSDGFMTYAIQTSTVRTSFDKGDTKKWYDDQMKVAASQAAAFILALLAACCNFSIMAGAFYNRIICKSKIFLVVTCVFSAIFGIISAALGTVSFMKGEYTGVQMVKGDGTEDLVILNIDYADVSKVSSGVGMPIVAIICSVLALLPSLLAKEP